MQPGLRLPPFGKELLELRKRGMRPESIIICAIDTWRYGMAYARVVIPEDLQPEEVTFAFVAGLDVAIVWLPEITSIERRDAVARQILKFDPISLRIVEVADPIGWIWIKSRAKGVEMPEFLS